MVGVWGQGDASVIRSVSASIKLPLSRCNDVSCYRLMLLVWSIYCSVFGLVWVVSPLPLQLNHKHV